MRKRMGLLAVCMVVVMSVTGCVGSVSNIYIKIHQYRGLEVEVEAVSESSVQSEISTNLGNYLEELMEVPDRTVEEGDHVVVDFSATGDDGAVISGTEGEDYLLKIGGGQFIEGWEENCIGQKFGEAFEFDLTFPEEYGSEDLAGKTVRWLVTVKGLVATLTEEVREELETSAETIEEYETEVREELQEESVESELPSLVWEELLNQTEVLKYPEDKVEELISEMEAQIEESVAESDMTMEEYKEGYEESYGENFDEALQEYAESQVKTELIVELLVERKIKISDEEYDEKCQEIADEYSFSSVDDMIEQAGEDLVKEVVYEEIVTDWLVNHCKWVVKEAQEEETKTEADSEEESTEETSE